MRRDLVRVRVRVSVKVRVRVRVRVGVRVGGATQCTQLRRLARSLGGLANCAKTW